MFNLFRRQKKNWWERLDFVPSQDMDPAWIFPRAILSNISGPAPTSFSYSGGGFLGGPKENLAQIAEDEGGQLLLGQVAKEDRLSAFYVWPNAILALSVYEDGHFGFRVYSMDKDLLERLKDRLEALSIAAPTRGFVHTIMCQRGEYSTLLLGQVTGALRRENYAPSVADGYDYMLTDLVSPTPTGRLTLLTGDPGTGKSHFIRGIMASSDASFLIIPPALVGSLSGPDFVGLLHSIQSNELPLVLVMEDSDQALVRREEGHMSAISDLLNLADGIVGELLDIRIIASTNAQVLELDRAITRPGRLSQTIQFPLLEAAHANSLLKELSEGKTEGAFTKPVSLAEVYQTAKVGEAVARGDTRIENLGGRKKRQVGFAAPA